MVASTEMSVAEKLDDWTARLELLDPAAREQALLSPPPDVVAAYLAGKETIRGWLVGQLGSRSPGRLRRGRAGSGPR